MTCMQLYNKRHSGYCCLRVDSADNNLVANGKVYVTIPSNVDADSDVDIFDIILIAGSYGSNLHVFGGPPYIPNYDINSDEKIYILRYSYRSWAPPRNLVTSTFFPNSPYHRFHVFSWNVVCVA